jgi:hypothetical protein
MKEITFDQTASQIICKFFSDENEKILKVEIDGYCRSGTDGSMDINKVFFLTTGHFFLIKPWVILFDLTKFNYEWSNTLLKILNFSENVGTDEYEKNTPMIFLISEKNEKGIASMLGVELNNLPYNYTKNSEQALLLVNEKMEKIEKEMG